MKEEYYSLLRCCLDPKKEPPRGIDKINWQELLSFAMEQSIVGIYWYGINTLSSASEDAKAAFSGNTPSMHDLLDWGAEAKSIELRNQTVNKYCGKAMKCFKVEGFCSCILKGQGNTLLYPAPYSRTPGDIDVWVIPTAERMQKAKSEATFWQRLLLSDRMETLRYVRSLTPGEKFKCQHIKFSIWDDMPMEVHFYPMYLEFLPSNIALQKFFKQYRDAQFANLQTLPDTDVKVAIPTPFFNAIYQLTHINVHLLIEGIGLRQFIDYYYVLRNVREEDHDAIRKILSRLHLSRLASAVMWIEQEVLGLPAQFCYIKPDAKRGRKLLREIETGGNFGHYDKRMNHSADEGFWHVQFRKIIKHSRYIVDYPTEELSEPVFRLYHYLWRQFYELKYNMFFK